MTLSLAAVLAIGLFGWHAGPAAPYLCGVVLPLSALAVFLVGCGGRILLWTASPLPFPLALTGGQQKSLDWIRASRLEAPPGPFWAACRVAVEVLSFRSLLRNSRALLAPSGGLVYRPDPRLWLAALVFHYALLLIALRHLRLALEPAPRGITLLQSLDGFFQVGFPRLFVSEVCFLLALAFLLGRRLWDARLRFLSLPGDYFPLLLLAALAATGLFLRHGGQGDAAAAKAFVLSIVSLRPAAPVGGSPALFAHLACFSALLFCFPFSKLMHMAGVFLSPTRTMPNNSRQRRHPNPWNQPADRAEYAQRASAEAGPVGCAGQPELDPGRCGHG
ncbi:MAG: sulfate reduction electron transfer complex DsrMKJOP subunit DsrM [Desulfovibrio sp.]|jgi:nitrate reductase gamma subunit|nr:sulfate reduction electron transfer complex DsrMKJOP subunit DsrM [Desulfovibrio sp.]